MFEKDSMKGTLSRRSLAKGMALGAITAALPDLCAAEEKHGDRSHLSELTSQRWSGVLPGVWRMRVGTPEKFTPVTSRFIPPAEAAMRELPAVNQSPLGNIFATVGERGTTVELPLEADEHLFGFGLQMLSFDQRGKKKVMRVNADPRFDTGDSHAPVPFYVSTRGYGIFVDTARFATFCCGTARRREEQTADQRRGYAEDAPKLGENERAHVMVQVDQAKGLDVYLFSGPGMLDVVRRFNLFSGGGVNPPEWGLGFWYRIQAKATDEEVLRLAKEFRERKIPCDVMGLEPGWQTHAYSCSFLWGEGFPDPAKFVKEMDGLSYKVNLWEHAFTHPSAPFHDAIAPNSGDYLVWQGLVPDFQDKRARQIFGDYHRKTFLDIGISGFKLDECDNSDYTGGWSFPEFSRFPSGQDGEQMHSVFGLRYQQTFMEQFDAAKRPTYGLVRCSGALAAPYPFVLYSDLYDHRAFVRSLVNSGFSGLLWCPEVRDADTPEDLIRRLQTVVFSPLAMINGWYIANPPWKQQNRKKNNANELEPGWERLEARCREVIEWRMMLLPYLRAAFASYALDATPPFRALILDEPSNPELLACDDQFTIGDRMMVAPLFAGEPSRKVVIPRGNWHDFWSGEAVAGGETIEVAATYERIPVYVKSGSVLPVGGVANSTADAATRLLTVRIFGDGSIPFSIGGATKPELRLAWKNGKGVLEQNDGARAYTVSAWIPATERFPR
jgi:alpha-D-xyloside xylohydrolase